MSFPKAPLAALLFAFSVAYILTPKKRRMSENRRDEDPTSFRNLELEYGAPRNRKPHRAVLIGAKWSKKKTEIDREKYHKIHRSPRLHAKYMIEYLKRMGANFSLEGNDIFIKGKYSQFFKYTRGYKFGVMTPAEAAKNMVDDSINWDNISPEEPSAKKRNIVVYNRKIPFTIKMRIFESFAADRVTFGDRKRAVAMLKAGLSVGEVYNFFREEYSSHETPKEDEEDLFLYFHMPTKNTQAGSTRLG